MAAMEDVLPPTCVQPCCWRGGGMCVTYSACDPSVYKLIHSPATVQCSGAACWLMHWRKPVILNWDLVLSTYQHSPCTWQHRNSDKFHLRSQIYSGWLWQTQTWSAYFCLSCLNGFICQEQQNPYIQEIGRRGGTNRSGAKLPHCGQDSRSARLCVATLVKAIGLSFGFAISPLLTVIWK